MHQQPPNPNIKESDGGDRPLPFLGFWILRAIAFLIATLGTASILALFLKPNRSLTATAIVQPAVKSSGIEPIAATNRQSIQVKESLTQNSVVPPQLPTSTSQPPLNVPQPSPSPQIQIQTQLPSLANPILTQPSPRLKKDVLDYLKVVFSKPINPAIAYSTPLDKKTTFSPLSTASEPPRSPSQSETVSLSQVTQLSESVSEKPGIKLTLSDVVFLALENNRDIKNAYLDRIVQKQNLIVEEGKFAPQFTPELSLLINRLAVGEEFTHSRDLGASATVSVKIPTGGEVSFGWTSTGRSPITNQSETDINRFDQNLQLRVNQPLLRGFGIAVNKASIEIARLTEQNNILELKSILIDTITDTIAAYRQLVQAQEEVKIQETSLENARRQLEITRAFIEAGRLAQVDSLQDETNIASREVSLLQAQNNLESVILQLVDILDIDKTLRIVASEIPSLNNPPNLNNLQQVALANNPDYLRSQLNLEIAKYDLLVAENNRHWNLDFDATYGNITSTDTDRSTDLRAGLTLRREFGDRTIEQRFQESRVNLLKTENTLNDLRDSLEIQVTDRIRQVNLNLKQVQLARRARELSEQKLANEQEKLKLGLGSSRIIDVVNFQNEVVEAKNTELSAIINYLNALTNLDRTVGTTLDTWQVKIESEEIREKGEGKREKGEGRREKGEFPLLTPDS